MSNFLKKEYSLINDIFCCSINDKSTQKVTNFYKETPFPNYKENDDRLSILEKGNKNILAYQFKKFIGLKKSFRSGLRHWPISKFLFHWNE